MKITKIGVDIDDVITALPVFFRELTHFWIRENYQVHIVTSRTDNDQARKSTIKELEEIRVAYNKIFFLPPISVADATCPHKELNWFEKYLWQKVDYCLKNRISIYFDDDEKVVRLFQTYAPEIQIFHIVKKVINSKRG